MMAQMHRKLAMEKAAEMAQQSGAKLHILAVGRIPEYAQTVSEVEEAKEQAGSFYSKIIDDAIGDLSRRGSQRTLMSSMASRETSFCDWPRILNPTWSCWVRIPIHRCGEDFSVPQWTKSLITRTARRSSSRAVPNPKIGG